METIYNVDYFIKKFEAIPEVMWIVGDIGLPDQPRCAMGHCYRGTEYTTETSSFILLFHHNGLKAYKINNGDNPSYQQPTPKQRILAALYDIKAKQQPAEPKEKIIYKTVVIDTAVQKLQKQLTEN